MRAELLDADSSRWTEVLAGIRHDFYHLPEYLRFAVRRQEAGEPLAFVAEDEGNRLFVPLIVRSIPETAAAGGAPLLDVSGPRGYPGPLVALDQTRELDDFVDRALQALTAALRERGVVSAFLRLHPLLAPPLEPFRRAGTIVHHGDSISIDLTLPDEELWRQTDHGHRQGIRKATRLGYAARVDDSWQRFDGFVAVYQETMRRLDARPFWHLTADYFRDLRETLGERIHLCVVEIGDELAAAGLLTELGGLVEFHLSGTADAHLRASPSKVLIDHARTWAKARGNDCFHLTGSLRPGDPLSQFKAGFSPARHPVWTWRLIVDPEEYRRLSSGWEAAHGVEADAPDGFFPAYRSPGRST
ncbi:MAG TPA: GNAT family N-acetyltransferase [Candidatus Deferrimicrobium sp.]|nr:GNAT family N-acetyltransferase [Candidatus Deferrimicrobium sp.]